MSESKHRPIPGYPGYAASADGQIFSMAHNWRGYGVRALKPDLNDDGYPSARLTVNGKRTRIAVHKLVAATFLQSRPTPAHEVRHLDGNKLNCAASNLAWGTRKDNADDREQHGRTSRGSRHSKAIKTAFERKGWNVKW